MDQKIVLCLVILNFISSGICQKQEEFFTQNKCITKTTCHECIQTPYCAWCFQPEFDDKKRCFPQTDGYCLDEYTHNPDNIFNIIENRSLSRGQLVEGGGVKSEFQSRGAEGYSGYSESESVSQSETYSYSSVEKQVVQLRPQRVTMKLRINQAQKLKISYAQAEDYPVDLYYLMDLSNSMTDDKDNLIALGEQLSNTMKKITSNFRLGFGSFVDKVVMPYVEVFPNLKSGNEPKVEAPYSYKHRMSLSENAAQFIEAVNQTKMSYNLDGPEGGFDAMMQAIVCQKNIGWRSQARRLLIYSTDAGFHLAGDGKLGGIVQPNDGHCHLDSNGKYTHAEIMDYPSIAHINQQLKKNAINVIFAATSTEKEIYTKLTNLIEGSSFGVLANDSSNIVQLVQEQYEKISSSVEMKDSSSSDVQIAYYSSCLSGGPPVKTNKCDGLKVSDQVEFSVEVTVLRCPPNRADWKQTVNIYPVGINESLTIDLEMQCDCNCEELDKMLSQEEKSAHCSFGGNYQCGVCVCFPGRYGPRCECGGTEEKNSESCRASPTEPECSGRGSCICGQCECNKRPDPLEVIDGRFCECDNFLCERKHGILCSGPDHGVCQCGKCECAPGWSGSACDCRSYNDTCIAPGTTELCSGHGSCVCGVCVCDAADNTHYSGKFCDTCPTCKGKCDEFRDCVECLMYGTGKLAETCELECTTFKPIPEKEIIQNEANDEHLCTYVDENDCFFSFVYTYDELNRVVVRAKEEKSCPPVVHVPTIILGVIGAIVLIGLALLMVWKMVTTIHDRKEFARFEKECGKTKWETGENPTYIQATSTFKNPMYAGN